MRKSIPAVPAALLSMICVQGGASIAKQLFPVLGASGTTTLRIGISAIILFFINRPNLTEFSRKQWLYCLGYGLCIAGMNFIFYLAIARIPLGLGVTVEFIGPLSLAFLFSRRPTDIIWALFAGVGILLIVPWQSSNVDSIGLLFALLAGAFWAGYIIVGGKISQVMRNRDAVSVGMIIAAIIILPFGISGGGLVALTPKYFLWAIGVAIFSSALPFTLDMIALNKLPSKTFSILTSLNPAFAALAGLIFLKEYLTLVQCLSIACVIIASVGTTMTNKSNN